MLKILLKFEIFDHPGPARPKILQNQDIWVALKIWLKFEIFVRLGPAKDDIWVTLEILLKFDIFDHFGPAKHEIWQNKEIESCSKLDSNLKFFAPVLQNM